VALRVATRYSIDFLEGDEDWSAPPDDG